VFTKCWENIKVLREIRTVYKLLEGDQFGVVHAVGDGIVLRIIEMGCEDAD
jgi:hypothetical protein